MTSAQFLGKDKLSSSLYTFWFKPTEPLDFIAGQFTQISLPHDNPDSRGEQRWFSLSSNPRDAIFSITTRVQENDVSSFKKQLFSLSSGGIVQVADAMGDFVLPKKITTPIAWIAAGVGIAPFISMAMANIGQPLRHDIDLFWTTNYEESLPHETLFAANTSAINTYRKGLSLTAEKLIAKMSAETLEAGLLYIAGPEKFVESLRIELLNNNLPANRIVADYFDGY